MKKIIGIICVLLLLNVLPSVVGFSATLAKSGGDELDQYSTENNGDWYVGQLDYGFEYNLNSSLAQSFIPQKKTFTRAQFFMCRNESTSYPLFVAIREQLTGENLASASVESSEFPSYPDMEWVEFDFEDLKMEPGETYYMIMYTENATDNYYSWGSNFNKYQNGSMFESYDDGKTWDEIYTDLGTVDGCFKTYGNDNEPLQIGISAISIGKICAQINNTGDIAKNVYWEINLTAGLRKKSYFANGLIESLTNFEEICTGKSFGRTSIKLAFGNISGYILAKVEGFETRKEFSGFVIGRIIILTSEMTWEPPHHPE